MDVGGEVGFDASFALAVTVKASVRQMQIGKVVKGFVGRDIGQKAIDCRRLPSLLLRAAHRWRNTPITLKSPRWWVNAKDLFSTVVSEHMVVFSPL